MARVVLSEADFRNGRIPAICAKSGRPTTGSVRVTFSDRPSLGLVPVLIMFGPVSYLLFRRALATRIVAALPLADGPRWRFLATQWTCIGLFVFALILWLAVLVFHSADAGTLGMLALGGLLCLVLLIAVTQSAGRAFGLRGQLDTSSPSGERFLELSNVRPEFVAAVHRNDRPLERSVGP